MNTLLKILLIICLLPFAAAVLCWGGYLFLVLVFFLINLFQGNFH